MAYECSAQCPNDVGDVAVEEGREAQRLEGKPRLPLIPRPLEQDPKCVLPDLDGGGGGFGDRGFPVVIVLIFPSFRGFSNDESAAPFHGLFCVLRHEGRLVLRLSFNVVRRMRVFARHPSRMVAAPIIRFAMGVRF